MQRLFHEIAVKMAVLAVAILQYLAPVSAVELPPMVPGRLEWDFIGNSFSDFVEDAPNGVGCWVQNFADEIEVTPDGTVIVGCDWDEGGRCLGLYKDGRPCGAALGKKDRQGGHRNGGWGTSTSAIAVVQDEILCASNDGEFYRFQWKPGDIESAHYRDGFVHGHGDAVNDKRSTKVVGMSARGSLVAVVLADGRIEIRRRSDWAVEHRFTTAGAFDVAWGSDALLWIATTNAVREVELSGAMTGRSLPDPGLPSALAVSPQGELVVCDDGPRQQVRFYATTDVGPVLKGTFGQKGGISAGTPGVPAPDKLMRPAGANRDAVGNLYVGLRYDEKSPTGGCIIRSFDPIGKLRWEAACHVFSECWDVVPDRNGRLTAYGYRSIFSKPQAGARGNWKLHTITLDSRSQPGDARTARALEQATTTWRELDGKSYIFTWGSGGNSPVEVTRLEARGLLGQPVATIGKPGPWAFDVDESGSVWYDENHTTILRRRYLGNERWSEPERFPLPKPLIEVHRLVYDATHDVMYASGYTDAIPKPQGEWGLIGRALIRVEHFTKQPALTWIRGLGVDDDNLPPKALCMAGDYLFTAACKPTAGLRGQIFVHRASDGGFVGRISAPKAIAQNTGWVDLSHGLRAREQDGVYYITQEDNLRGKVILHTWRPGN